MGKLIRVAIDGPSGAGKSTIAKKVAKALDLDYIDTGAMYRACGYKMSVNGIEAKSGDALQAMLDDTDIDFSNGSVYLDGQNIDKQIRTSEASMAASKYFGLHEVRAKLADLQRSMGKFRSVIMDGRDIGTNILTDAEYKFYLNASAEVRADRRYKELIEKGENVKYGDVLEDINKRDYDDIHRKLNPLKKADDAIEIDTSNMSVAEVTDRILKEINQNVDRETV